MFKFAISKIKNKYASNTAWAGFEQVYRLVVAMFAGILVSRYLGPEKLGQLNYAITVVAFFAIISKFGLHVVLVREFVNCEISKFKIVGTAFRLRLILSLIGLIGILLLSAVTVDKYLALAAFILIFQTVDLMDSLYQAEVKQKKLAIAKIIQLTFSLVTKLALVFVGADLEFFILSILLDNAILSVIYFAFLKWEGRLSFLFSFDRDVCVLLVSRSYPLFVSSIFATIQGRFDQIILNEMVSSYALGLYIAAYRLMEVFGIVPAVVLSSIAPAILNGRKISERVYSIRIVSVLVAFLLFSASVVVFCFYFGKDLIVLLYGPKFEASGAVVILLSLITGFGAYASLREMVFVNEGMQKHLMVTNGFGAFVSVPLSFFLIPQFGLFGMVIAQLLTYFFALIVLDLVVSKSRKLIWGIASSTLQSGRFA